MEDLTAADSALDWTVYSGLSVDYSRMVSGTQPCPVWIWFGSVLLWILTSICFIVDAKNILRYNLEEEVPSGTLVGDVLKDSHIKRKHSTSVMKQLYFTFLSEPDWNVVIEKDTGLLRTNGRIDREGFPHCVNKAVCQVTVDVAVQPVQYFMSIKVVVKINDINDNEPEYSEPEITHPILESAAQGNSFSIPTAYDKDSPVFGVVKYELESHRNTFSISVEEKLDGSLNVLLTIDRRLDRERRHHYKVKVVAFDGGDPAKEGRLTISIPILDSNDNRPTFDQSIYNINIPENLASGTSILRVEATDPDLGQNGKIQYGFSIQTETLYGKMLAINSNTGEIFAKGEIDREQVTVCNLVVTARDSGPNAIPSDASVIVKITDANDNSPEIQVSTLGSPQPYMARTPEDSAVGSFVAHVITTDPDEGPNGLVNCSLNDYTFSLEQTFPGEYQIITTRHLDREHIPQYGLELVCRDQGQPPQVTIKRITVDVTDVNDNAPRFKQKSYAVTILENNYVGRGILQTDAWDQDRGVNGQIRYSLSNNVKGVFDIDPESGGIKAVTRIDREETQKFEFNVIATDFGIPPKSSSAVVVINIGDVDDSKPEFVSPTFTFRVLENEPVGSEVGKVTALDKDVPPNNKFFYSFEDEELSSAFHLNSKTGQISSQQLLDREQRANYKLVVKATDQKTPAMSSTAIVNIRIIDVNDHPPSFIYPNPRNHTLIISNKVPKGSRITHISAHDLDEGANSELFYSIVKGNEDKFFRLDSRSGWLSTVTYFTDMKYREYTFTIQVADNGDPQHQAHTELQLKIDSQKPYHPNKAQTQLPQKGTFHYNVIVVVAVTCGATVIVVSCVICIVLVRRNKQRRNNCSGNHKPNGPTESHRMLASKDSPGSTDDQIAMKDIDVMDLSESMSKLLVANNKDWDKASYVECQGDIGLEITKVLSEMDDDSAELPELLSHTKGRDAYILDENGGLRTPPTPEELPPPPPPPPLPPPPLANHEDREDGDSDTTASITGPTLIPDLDVTITKPGPKTSQKGKVSFGNDMKQQSSPRGSRGSYQYPPPPPPPPNRLRTFCPDGKLPDSPQRSCLVQDNSSLQRRAATGPHKVVTWQPSPDLSSQNSNYDNSIYNSSLDSYTSEMDPWEHRRTTTSSPAKTESMIV